MPFIKSIPVRTLYSVSETLCYDLPENDKLQGCYRNLEELLVKLDGAPMGKDDTSWLVGFLNIGRGILSSSENYLLFGANCPENCIPVQRCIKMLMSDIQKIEKSTFQCTYNNSVGMVTVDVKFKIGELPNDMKMLAFLSEELSNGAKFFSSFAVNASFGIEKDNTWQPWQYSERLSVAKGVEMLKTNLAKQKLSDSTKRSRITTFISSKGSRQEFVPPLGALVDKIHVEPLHLKNNARALAHRYLLDEVMLLSNLPCSVKNFFAGSKHFSFCKVYMHHED